MFSALLMTLMLAAPPARTAEQTLSSALNVGDKAPEFTLKDATGSNVTLSQLLKKGPVILTWYRGGWCPYCNIALKDLQGGLPQFSAAGATLVAISPELPDHSLDTREKHALAFPVLSDVGLTVADAYGISYTLDSATSTRYNAGFGLNTWNGDTSNRLPLPVTYVVNREGIIVYRFIDTDIRKRAPHAEILNALLGK
jgi:peroxiredoxin